MSDKHRGTAKSSKIRRTKLNLPSDFPLKSTLNIMFHLMDGFSDRLADLQNLVGSHEDSELKSKARKLGVPKVS